MVNTFYTHVSVRADNAQEKIEFYGDVFDTEPTDARLR